MPPLHLLEKCSVFAALPGALLRQKCGLAERTSSQPKTSHVSLSKLENDDVLPVRPITFGARI